MKQPAKKACPTCGQPQYRLKVKGFNPDHEEVEIVVHSIEELAEKRSAIWRMFKKPPF